MAGRAKVIEFPLAPGQITDDTALSTKFHAYDTDKVRVRGQRYETIGGWESFSASNMTSGIPHSCLDWSDLNGNPILAAASANAINVWYQGTRSDVTPEFWIDVWLSRLTAQTPSNCSVMANTPTTGQVTIYWSVFTPATTLQEDAEHNLVVGDVVTISMYSKAAGDTIDLNGSWTVVAVPSKQSFVINCSGTKTTFNSPTTAYRLTLPVRSGLTDGVGDSAAQRARIWSLDNFGENLVAVGSDGTPLFAWQPVANTSNLIKDGTRDTTVGATTMPWYNNGSTGVYIQDITGVLEGGKVYEIEYDAVPSGSLPYVRIDNIDIYPSDAINPPAPYSGHHKYRFVCPPAPEKIKFQSMGAIDNVSVKLVTKAFPINSAPQKSMALFVDGNKVLNLLGTVGSGGVFDAQNVRWSDVANYYTWVASTDNSAGEFRLGRGNYVVCGIDAGDRNVILTDSAAYAASWNGKGYTIKLLGRGCGGLGPNGICAYNGRAFWVGQRNFYAYDGAQVIPLQTPIKNTIVGKVKQYQYNKTFAWFNRQFGEAWFHWVDIGDSSNEPSRALVYNLLESNTPWTEATMRRTCFTHNGAFRDPIGFASDGSPWSHEKGNVMTGAEVLPFLETGYITAEAGDRWTGVRRWYPDIKDQVGVLLFTITGKLAPQDGPAEQVIGPIQVPVDKRVVDFLLSTRQTKLKWASQDVTNYWRMGTVGLEVLGGGSRR